MYQPTHGCKVPWQVPPAKRVALLDADGLLYSAALNGMTLCDGEQLQVLEDEEIYLNAMTRIAQYETLCGDTAETFICLTDRTNFRTSILPSYKANRKPSVRPKALDALRTAVAEQNGYPVKLIKGLEADDVCGIAATSFQELGYETVIVSPDKDLLQIPGMILTPRVAKRDVVFSEITEPRALRWHAYQTLVGDTTDNYSGCPGVGPRRAEALLEGVELIGFSPVQVWDAVRGTFETHGYDEEYALTQARVSRILRFEDWDQIAKEPIPWNFPR